MEGHRAFHGLSDWPEEHTVVPRCNRVYEIPINPSPQLSNAELRRDLPRR